MYVQPIDAVQLLLNQHRRVEALLRAIEHAGADERRQAFADAADELALHIGAEEAVFYPAVSRLDTKDMLLEALEEHLSLKRLLADLLALALDDATFAAKCEVLREQCEHHHREEEDELFPKAVLILDSAHREALGHEILRHQGLGRRAGAPRHAVFLQTDVAEPLPLI